MRFPLRSLSNVKFDAKVGYFEMGRKTKERTLAVATVKTFAQSLKMIAEAKKLIESDDIATKREAYYIAKGWQEAVRFSEQTESDTVLDDIEALFKVNRERLGFVPEEKGGEVAGNLMVIDRDNDTAEDLEIDCTRFGSGAYSIPSSVEQLSFETKAKFILAIETGGVFQRLQSHRFWETANCVLVSLAGVPTRSTRRFIRKLSDDCKIPVYAFVDCDPYGFSKPRARYLGVTPQDILDYELPTHPLQEVDIKRAKDALKNDPFFKTHKSWKKAIEQLISMGVRAEQQSLAMWGLNYVMDEYLPAKLKKVSQFLP